MTVIEMIRAVIPGLGVGAGFIDDSYRDDKSRYPWVGVGVGL